MSVDEIKHHLMNQPTDPPSNSRPEPRGSHGGCLTGFCGLQGELLSELINPYRATTLQRSVVEMGWQF